ncbi:MAG: hypothetical protein GPJ54_03730 [Candidatus Heimdallarchaeota archaeon]|nr:hypothetical protein [Candidatus Heimdallarchaeota archaeon]
MEIEERKNFVRSIFASLDNHEFDNFRTLLIDNLHPDAHMNKIENTGSRLHQNKSFEESVESWIKYNRLFENNYNILYLMAEGDKVGAFIEVTQILLEDWQLETINKVIPKGSEYTLLQFHGITFKDNKLYTMDRVSDWVKRDIGWGIISEENKDMKISAYFHHLQQVGLIPVD